MQRGDIFIVDLPIPKGSEPGYKRPMVVIQNNDLCRSKLPTAMLCPLTTKTELARFPGNVLVKSKETGLQQDSVILVHQIVTLNEFDLGALAGHVPDSLMLSVDEGLRYTLDL